MFNRCINTNCMNNRNIDPSTGLCPKCDMIIMSKIKDYIEQHPRAQKREISKETKISINIINSLIDSGRINYIIYPEKKKECKKCKNTFFGGSDYCEECLKKLTEITRELGSLYNERERLIKEQNKQRAKMHTTIKF